MFVQLMLEEGRVPLPLRPPEPTGNRGPWQDPYLDGIVGRKLHRLFT